MNRISLGLASVLLLWGCGGGNDSSNSADATGNVSVTLRSPALSSRRAVTLSSCSPNFGSGPVSGECFTPISFTAKATKITLGANFVGSTPPARIIDLAAAPEGTGLEGPFGALGLASFDFSSEAVVTNQYSEDNVQDSSSTETIYDFVRVHIGSAEVKFEIPSTNSNVTNRFWTVRYAFGPQNPTDHSAFSTCSLDTGIQQTLSGSDGQLYSAPTDFQQGDILVCQKSTTTETCADSDFNFIDSGTGALSTTRPTNTLALSNEFWIDAPTCSETDQHPEMFFGGSSFIAEVSTPFKLTKTQTQPEDADPYYTYTFTPDCNTSTLECTGTVVSARAITASVSFNMTDSMFAHGDVDVETDTEANLLKNLTKIMPKNFYNASIATAHGDPTQNTNVTATVTITETTSRD